MLINKSASTKLNKLIIQKNIDLEFVVSEFKNSFTTYSDTVN